MAFNKNIENLISYISVQKFKVKLMPSKPVGVSIQDPIVHPLDLSFVNIN